MAKELKDFYDPAKAHADRVAPLPTIPFFQAGIFGVIFATIVILVFGVFADLSAAQSNKGALFVIPLSFVVPYFYIEYRRREHFTILTEEQHRLHKEAGESPE